MAINADGVHLGQDDLSPEAARELLGNDAIIGYSTHNIEQASIAKHLPIDYIAIGPIFDTSTKKNPDKVVGLEEVKQVSKELGDFPLVAIGGVGFDNFQQVLDAGADSVAIISGILKDSDNISQNFPTIFTNPILINNVKNLLAFLGAMRKNRI